MLHTILLWLSGFVLLALGSGAAMFSYSIYESDGRHSPLSRVVMGGSVTLTVMGALLWRLA